MAEKKKNTTAVITSLFIKRVSGNSCTKTQQAGTKDDARKKDTKV